MIYLLSFDWLALYCTRPHQLEMPLNSANYTAKLAEFNTRHYKHLYYIYKDKEPIAELQIHPHSKVLDENGCIIKFCNRLLYSVNLFPTIDSILQHYNLTPQNISRLDLAGDFNSFINDYAPEDLIKDFVSQRIRKKGRAVGVVAFRQRSDGMHYNGLKFGTRESNVCIYLYNKTLELKEVHDKPYIRDSWKAAGLDMSQDIWRLEVSIKPEGLKIADKDTGEVKNYNYNNIEQCKQEIYNTFVKSLFTFAVKDNANISRCTVIKLLPTNGACNRIQLRNVTGSTVVERMLIKKLHTISDEYRYFSELGNIASIADIHRAEDELCRATDLEEWRKNKLKYWSAIDRKE